MFKKICLQIPFYRPVSFSLMASFISSITLLGVSNENYQYGTQFVVINVSYGLMTPVICYLYLPVFYNLKTTSAYQVISEIKFIAQLVNGLFLITISYDMR